MDPVPDIGTTPQPTDATPSGGAFSRQRQAAQARRRAVTKKKQLKADGPSDVAPGCGPPDADG